MIRSTLPVCLTLAVCPALTQACADPVDPPPAVSEAGTGPSRDTGPSTPETTSEDDLSELLCGLRSGPVGAPPPAAADKGVVPASLSRQQILAVVKRNAGRIFRCRAGDAGVRETISVKLTVETTGEVSSAVVVTPGFVGTVIGACVVERVLSFRFPRFSGDPLSITLPFRV